MISMKTLTSKATKIAFIFILTVTLLLMTMPMVAHADGYTLSDGQASTNANLAVGTPSANLRDTNDSMKYSEGVYSMKYTGNWLRGIMVVDNPLTSQDKVLLNGAETDTSTLTTYYDCNIKWSDAQQFRSLGIVLGRHVLAETNETVYVSVNIQPQDNSLVFYFYKKVGGDADVNYTVALTQKFKNDTTYRLSVLKTTESVSVYVNGSFKLGEFSTIEGVDGVGNKYSVNLTKLHPVAGANFMDIDATISDLTVKYLESGVYSSVVYGKEELEYARNYDNNDIFSEKKVAISGNQRNLDNNGLSFDGSVATMKYTGSWLRAVNYFKNDYLSSNTLIKNGEKVSTEGMDVYYKASFKLSSAPELNRTLGLIVGKTTVLGQTVYISCNVSPASGQAAMYFCTSHPYDFTYEVNCGITVEPNTQYTLEIVIKDGTLHMYLDGKQCMQLDSYTVSAYGSDDVVATVSMADLTPCFGVNFMDINAQMYDFEMKYLTDYESIYYFVEPDYPDYSKDYVYNTEKIPTIVETIEPTDNTLAIILIVGGGVLILASIMTTVILYTRRKKS